MFMSMESTEDDVEVNFGNEDKDIDLLEELLYPKKEIKRLKKRIVEEVKVKYSLSQKLESVKKMIIDIKNQTKEAKRIE